MCTKSYSNTQHSRGHKLVYVILIYLFIGKTTKMQRHTSNQSEIKIPPNLLKNFNVYEILEPQKIGAGNSDANKVDKLIDIDDCSRDSGYQDLDLPSAFLDKNKDVDLIDVYENMLVTPQHIKKKKADDDATAEVDAAFGVSNLDAGFKHFFDKLESGEKVDWLNISQPQEETFTDHAYIDKKPRVLVPKVFTEPDSDPEDLIQEVLMQKKLEQLALGNVNNARKVSESRERESPKKTNKKHNPVLKVAQPEKEPEVIPEFSRSSLINNVVKDSNLFNGGKEKVSRPSEMEIYPGSLTDNSLTNFTVKAIQKDEKVYKKKRIVKPEYQTANYTKGPDFYEKSVVLPQIMARLNTRLAYLDQKNNQKKRLILDFGVRPKPECSSAKLNTQVKKPNNQVLSNTKVQVIKRPESTTATKNDLTKKTLNKASSSGINSLNMKNIPIKEEARLCINKLTKDIRVHTTDKPCTNCGNPSTSKKDPVAIYEEELTPVVLMEDCNKERLRALKRSQMFKEFVLNGKISHEG